MSDSGKDDVFYNQVKAFCKREGRVATSLIQRKFQTGYGRSAAMVLAMENEGFCSRLNAVGPRTITSASGNQKEGDS